MEKILILCVLSALAGCATVPAISEAGTLKAMAPIPFVARLALGADAAEAGYQVKSLLPKDEGCGAYKPTDWDVQIVSGADVYLSIGLPFEAELITSACRRNPGLRVVSLDQKCWRIEGNPYVWTSGVNLYVMEAAAKEFFGCKKFCICGSPYAPLPVAESIARDKLENYAVAILHPAFAYECGQHGVKTVTFDAKSFRDEYAAEIKDKDITLILALPSQRWIGDELAGLSHAKVAYVDLLGGASPVDVDINLIEDLSVRRERKYQREALEEEERELASLSPAERRLEDVHIPQIAFYAPATMKDAAELLTQASEDYGPPELLKEERRIMFTCTDDAARLVAPPRPEQLGISPIPTGPMTDHMSLRAALQYVCERTGCVYEAVDRTVRISLPAP